MANLPQRRLLLGGGEDEQGMMRAESCKGDVEMVHPATMTTTATATASMAAPIEKLELNGYHGPPLLLHQTREAKQEVTERPLGVLSGLKQPRIRSRMRRRHLCWSVWCRRWVRTWHHLLLSFAITIGKLCAASYKIVGKVQCLSSTAGRWRNQRYVDYPEFEFKTYPSSCSFHYIRH